MPAPEGRSLRIGLGLSEGERDCLVESQLLALLPRLGEGVVVELGVDERKRRFVPLLLVERYENAEFFVEVQ